MKPDLRVLVLQIAGMGVVFALAIFLPAGTMAWPAGWVFLGEFFGFVLALSLWLLRSNPELLHERMTGIGAAGQKDWDKVFFAVASVLFLGWLVVMPLDAVRFRWSRVPGWLQQVGAMVLLVSFGLFFRVFRENAYLSPAVRMQPDRGQVVVSTGPYRVVRHPMYAALIPFCAGTALLLGSRLGLAASFPLIGIVAWRAVREEGVLQEELPGYREYMHCVRYRLIPHVW
jgi:protein-S-isoprenylcysteine O-methyltransferase Ste14